MIKNTVVPYVIDNTGKGERSYDIYSRLLEDRVIFLTGEINDAVADAVVAGATVESNAEKINELLAALRAAGFIEN